LNGSVITASASYSQLPIATNVNDVGTAGSTGTAASYAPADHVHAGVVRIAAGSNTGNTLGDTVAKHGNWVIAGTNGVTVSGSTGGASNTAWLSVNTSYRASNDGVGLNTAQSNVTWTVNSAGISLNANGYAGTTTGFTGGASISGSMTHNTLGLAISLSHPAWLTTRSAQAFSADASSTFQTLSFQNSNGVSFSNNAGALRVTHDLQYTSATSAITSAAFPSASTSKICRNRTYFKCNKLINFCNT